MRKKGFIFSWLIILFTSVALRSVHAQETALPLPPHQPHTLVIKTMTPLQGSDKDRLGARLGSQELSGIQISSITPTLPWIDEAVKRGRLASHSLANIYTLTLSENVDLQLAIDALRQSDQVIYAEPYYLYKPLIVPNDQNLSSQYYLNLISAFDAWNVEQGDTTITIAMLDTGTDYTHEDMLGSIQYNLDDPVNGLDDDEDGLIDNYYGWDIANNDNIPLDDTDFHGSTVSGVSSAMVNNELGIAGVGFRSRIMPIKIFTSGANTFRNGYEAIALAADLGCQVINLSWGEARAYSAFGEDIIRYAVLEKDAAVVAAAGNTNGNIDFYPASFPYVLSVGATGPNDIKTPWGTYSPYIDLMAPGENIATVGPGNTYTSTSGSSLSSPMVAAAVALIRARFPTLNARQAMERVRVNAE